jgi:hypothetical protein
MTTSHSAAPRAQVKRQAPEASVHMNVLGMDGTDHDIGVGRRNNNITRDNNTDASHAEGAGNEKKAAQESSSLGSGTLPSRPATPGRGRKPPPSSPSANIPHANPRNSNNNSRENTGQHTVPSASDKSHWWGKVLWGKTAGGEDDDDDDNASAQYQSLEAPEGDGSPQRMAFGTSGIHRRSLSSSSLITSSASASTTTVEDRLKQDCSFFYQGIEDSPSASLGTQQQNNPLMGRAAGLRPLASALNHQVPRLLSSREGARYRAQYERLNQDIIFVDSDDLLLDDYQEDRQRGGRRHASGTSEGIDFSIAATTSQNTERLSSLFFEQDGRMLMKLPRDQVRLIVDEDLESGIISVEQWRAVDKNNYNPAAGPALGDEEGMMMILEDEGKGLDKGTLPPPLRYVMTVPDDLYRRVVAEMSYALVPPCWGFFKCCDAEGRADIKLALAILAVILFLMFISTMEWPTE